MNETANNGPLKTGTLSDRVRSLRLTETAEQPSGGGAVRRLPWVFCVLLLGATGLLAMEAFAPIDDELVKKLAEEARLERRQGNGESGRVAGEHRRHPVVSGQESGGDRARSEGEHRAVQLDPGQSEDHRHRAGAGYRRRQIREGGIFAGGH